MFVYLLEYETGTVSSVANDVGMEMSVASRYLRALNARGILAATCSGRFVHYRVRPNPSVDGAQALTRALKRAFDQEGRGVDEVFRDLTACTHPRRLDMISRLRKSGRMRQSELRRHCGMSIRAMLRHVTKLERRGFLTRDRQCVAYREPDSHLAKVLVRLVCVDS